MARKTDPSEPQPPLGRPALRTPYRLSPPGDSKSPPENRPPVGVHQNESKNVMNRTHRTVWNASLGAWVATSEAARRGHKSGVRSALSLAAVVPLLAAMGTAQAACSTIGSTVTCTGVPGLPLFLNNFSSATNGLTVNVNSGAQMNATLGGAVMNLNGVVTTLNNSGTIDPALLGLVSVLSGGVAMGTGVSTGYSITNLASGIIRGTAGGQGATLTSVGGLALNVNNGMSGFTSIVNSGTVTSTRLSTDSVVASDAPIVGVRGGGQVNMTNNATGVLTGRTAFEASTAGNAFTNFGTINGGVALGAGGGANSFSAVTGSSVGAAGGTGQALGGLSGVNLTFAATGQVDGGAGGANTLTLRNVADDHSSTGSGTASAATYVNFANLTVQGGTWALQGALVSGSTTLNGGVAMFSDAAAFGSGVLTSSGGAVQATANEITVGNGVSLGAGGLMVQGLNSMSLTGEISGSGGLTKNGAGQLTLGAANTYVGGTTLNAGVLTLGNGSALGTGDLSVGGTTSLSGTSALSVNNGIVLAADLTVTGSEALTLSGNIGGAGGLIKAGAATLTLSGANSQLGTTALNAGTLVLGSNTALGLGALNAASSTTLDASTAVTVNNQVNLAGALTVGGSADMALTGAVNGIGGLVKNGAATLALGGSNSQLGATALNAGTLVLGSNTALGLGALNAAAGTTLDANTSVSLSNQVNVAGALTVAGSASIALTGTVNGAGSLTKSGSAALTLNGANGYSGGTTLNAGTLVLGHVGALGSGALTVDGGVVQTSVNGLTLNNLVSLGAGGLRVYGSNDMSLSSAVSGAGGLTMGGTGRLTLGTANTYAGGTTLNDGTLILGDASALGTGALTVDGDSALSTTGALSVGNDVDLLANLTVTGSQPLTLSGDIGGTGGLIKSGAETLTLSGVNTYSGGTTISAGTLQGNTASLTGNIANGALLVFDQVATGTYEGVLSGGGALGKTGGGNLILSGVSTFSGPTSVEGGTLSVNGSLADSTITVQSGGALGGSGVVGTTTIAAGAALAPGNSIGTLSVAGNLAFAPSSVYRVEVDADGHNDRTNVTGTAALNGAVALEAASGSYAASTNYTILNAAGGLSGTFSSVTSDLAFLTPSLTYDANNVLLNLARNEVSFSSVALTPNQTATSAALESAGAGATGDMATVQGALTGLSAEQARSAYDSVGGAGLVALRGAGAAFSAGFGNLLQTRMGTLQGGNARGEASAFSNRPLLLAANGHLPALTEFVSDSPQQFALSEGALLPSASTSRGLGFWLRGSGGHQNTNADGNAAASKVKTTALSTGFDTQLDEGVVVGAALSTGSSRLSFDSTADAGDSRGTALAVYGSYVAGPWAFKGAGSAAWNSNHMDRTVAVGALVRQASADFGSHTLSAYGEAMYSIPMSGWTLRPVAALSISRDKVDGFTETGAGALNLQVAGQTSQSTQSLLGAQASFEAGRVRLEPRAVWAHEFGDINRPMSAQFQGAAVASPFQVAGVALKRDTLILGLGLSGDLRRGTELFADVQLEHNSRQSNAGVLVGLRANW